MSGLLKFITCGSVDDGKSTLIGHILYDSKLLYADQEKALELDSKVGSRGGAIDYSLLLDGLMAEREQGITIDVAYRYFTTEKRSFIVADTPGHEEYTRNMAVGASFADLAVILVDAKQGVLVQTRRHARICALMGIRYFVFAVNKMDLVDCSEDILDKNWQRLVYTHLCEKMHRGVLTGSELTDMKITLVAGRAHPKHTEGGDFRQATYRAVRQGLMQAESVLLEPFYAFSLEVKRDYVGRAMTDFERMGAAFNMQEADGDNVVITGEGPVSVIGNYQAEVNAYTKGTGRLALKMAGYRPCHNTEEVIERFGYEPERDTRNPVDSVFCAGGSGYVVPWNEVREHAHVEIAVTDSGVAGGQSDREVKLTAKQASRTVSDEWIGTDEVDRILNETYFSNSRGDNKK